MSVSKITRRIVTVGPDNILGLEILIDGVRYDLLVGTTQAKTEYSAKEFSMLVLGEPGSICVSSEEIDKP